MMLIMRKCDDDEDNEDMSQVTDGQLSPLTLNTDYRRMK